MSGVSLYGFRLKAQDGSGHHRSGTIAITPEELKASGASSAKALAEQILKAREQRFADFQLSPELIAALEAPATEGGYGVSIDEILAIRPAPINATEEEKERFRVLRTNHRAWTNLHRQEKPYRLELLADKKKQARNVSQAITVKLFGLTAEKVIEQAGADVNLLTGTVEFSLHTNTYSPNRDTHDFMDDATNELSGSGYARQTLSGKAVTYDSGSDEVRFDCNDITVPFNASSTWRHGVVSINTAGAASTDPLYALLTWDSDQTVSTPYTLTIDPAGLLFWDTT